MPATICLMIATTMKMSLLMDSVCTTSSQSLFDFDGFGGVFTLVHRTVFPLAVEYQHHLFSCLFRSSVVATYNEWFSFAIAS